MAHGPMNLSQAPRSIGRAQALIPIGLPQTPNKDTHGPYFSLGTLVWTPCSMARRVESLSSLLLAKVTT